MGTKKPIISVIVDHKIKDALEKLSKQKKVSISKVAAELIKRGLEIDHLSILTYEVVDNIPYMIWIKDRNLRYIYVNNAILDFLGLESKDQIIGKTDIEVLPEELAKVCLYSDMALLNRGEKTIEIESFKKDGKTIFLETTKIPIKDESGKVIALLGTAKDITEVVELRQKYEKSKKELENALKKITELCDLDPVTGIYNRSKFTEMLNRALDDIKRTNKNYYVILLDIYNFKYFNEIYGTDIGNKMLKHIVNEIKYVLSRDSIKGEFAKVGEDEFGILVEGVLNINMLLRKLKSSLRDIYIKDEQGRAIKLPRILLVAYKIPPYEINTGEKIITLLEIELFNLKNTDEDIKVLIVDKVFKKSNTEKEEIVYDTVKKGKILPYTQGIFSTDGFVQGYELFFRMESKGKILTAEELLPAAFTTGLILDIDRFMLKVAKKLKQKINKPIHINLSSLTLYKSDISSNNIVDLLINVRDYAFFEVAELDFLNNLKTIKDLHKKYRLNFVIDKLGVKYCPIKLIVELYSENVVSMVKLDKNLIKGLINDENSIRIVETIVNLSKNFGIKTVAVGVENEEIYKAVKNLSIDMCQGFFFESPKSIESK